MEMEKEMEKEMDMERSPITRRAPMLQSTMGMMWRLVMERTQNKWELRTLVKKTGHSRR